MNELPEYLKNLTCKRSRTKTVSRTASHISNLNNIEVNPRSDKRSTDQYCISDQSVSDKGKEKIANVQKSMPGIVIIKEVNKNTNPLKNCTVCICSGINASYAVLIKTLIEFGANISICSSNINSIDNNICAALVELGVSVFAWMGESQEDYWWCIDQCITSCKNPPDFVIDDGGDLTNFMYEKYPQLFHKLRGIIETNTFGIYKLYKLVKEEKLLVPAMNITESITLRHVISDFYFKECLIKCFEISKELFVSGKKILLCGFGHRGKACSKILRALGVSIYVAEIDPICALQACMEGIEVVTIDSVISVVDGIIFCTDNKDILSKSFLENMKNGCLIMNYGHTSSLIDMNSLTNCSDVTVDTSSSHYTKVTFSNQKNVKILFHGDPVQGVSFELPETVLSIQSSTIVVALLELKLFSAIRYNAGVYLLPKKLDEYIASIHLNIFGASLTKLTDEQADFLGINKAGPFKSPHYRY